MTLYGLRVASKNFYDFLSAHLLHLKFKRTIADGPARSIITTAVDTAHVITKRTATS